MGSPIGDFAVRQLARLAKLQEVAWTRYATAYDWLLLHDAAYREILSDFEEECGSWTLRDDEIIVDIGAGTGNFSIAAARTHPATQVIHIDADKAMNAAAADKAADRGLTNISFVTADVWLISISRASVWLEPS